MALDNSAPNQHYDILIVGAGISGINFAHRLVTSHPELSFAILETRHAIGGTWDLFRFPGIRTDSDLHSFGFTWYPWRSERAIASGAEIKAYLEDAARAHGIDRRILFGHRVRAADWSTEAKKWTLTADSDAKQQEGPSKTFVCRWAFFCTGYYDYHNPLEAVIPGLERFQGEVIHPQFWPSSPSALTEKGGGNWSAAGKRIVVIGSGATAVTMLPALVADGAAHVTMLQRSPSFIAFRPVVDPTQNFLRTAWPFRWLCPEWLTYRIMRFKFITQATLLYWFCMAFPLQARKLLLQQVKGQLPSAVAMDPHFSPRYNPWEQRLCVSPDADFFAALRGGRASVATGAIETVTEHGVRIVPTPSRSNRDDTSAGSAEHGHQPVAQYIPADVIVTATGIRLQLGGATRFSIDSRPLDLGPSRLLWHSTMVTDLPNLALVVGYPNASWTLAAEATALQISRLLGHMRAHGYVSAIPRVSLTATTSTVAREDGDREGRGGDDTNNETVGVDRDDHYAGMKLLPVLRLSSTYVASAAGRIPRAADRGPWKPRGTYFGDLWTAMFGSVTDGLVFEKGGT